MSPSPEPSGFRVGYVLKKFPRVSETFVVDELLALEGAGLEPRIYSLRLPDDGRFHSDLGRLRSGAEYVPGFGSASTLEALRGLADVGMGHGRLRAALAFADALPAERGTSVLVQGLWLARRARFDGVSHLHAHFMTVAAHTAYVAHLMSGLPFSVTAHAKDIYRSEVDPVVFSEVAGAAEAVVTVCDANRRRIHDLLGGRSARVVTIRNGVPVDRIAPTPAPRDPQLIVGVGRLVEKKGFGVLLDACHLLAKRGARFRLVLLGDGEDRDALLRQRTALGLEGVVRMPGAATRDEALAWMRRARVLAAPCVRAADGNQDALPTVLLEALAVGLPVVATPIGGIPEIVDDGVEGFLVPERDPAALANALERLLVEDETWETTSAAGRAKAVRSFDRAERTAELIDVFVGTRSALPPAGDRPMEASA